MKPQVFLSFFLLLLLFIIPGCKQAPLSSNPIPPNRKHILVTNSTFESALQEFPLPADLKITRLSEPGTCPGHYDILPSQALSIREASLILRFDFQSSLDPKIKTISNHSEEKIRIIPSSPGMCKPETYLRICQEIGKILQQQNLISLNTKEEYLRSIEKRLNTLSEQLHQEIQTKALLECQILVSPHQEEFCRWLGLTPAGTFSSADNFTVKDLANSIKKGNTENISLIIANEPEGRKVADLLGEKLHTPVIVFSNFPQLGVRYPFDEMLKKNIRSLPNLK